MSKADEMFKKLGFYKYIDNDITVLYKKDVGSYKASISFDKKIEKFSGHCSMFVPNDYKNWITQKFKKDWERYCSTQGHWESVYYEFGIEELQAINEKVKELRWLDE